MMLNNLASWKKLQQLAQRISCLTLNDLFAGDKERLNRFSLFFDQIFFDYSKNLINPEILDQFNYYLEDVRFFEWREKMWRAEKINHTEERAVLHVALRTFQEEKFVVDGIEVNGEIAGELQKMERFVEQILNKEWTGFSGKPITHVVNIGIGGSDLGPRMVVDALKKFRCRQDMRFYFIANIDQNEIDFILPELDPQTTLFVITSKTFATEETLTNAETLRHWLLSHYQNPKAVEKHFVAVSTALDKVKAFGINPDNCFTFWEWVGGRFSLSSAVGLSIMLAIGPDRFRQFLAGMASMDKHFKDNSLAANIPLLSGLLAFWNTNFLGVESHLILPYSRALELFPAYLQQLIMESNGKSVDRQGQKVSYKTSAAIWGGSGTNSQHSFFQLLHQGTVKFSADLIGFFEKSGESGEHHKKLLAHLFAQSEVLAFGHSEFQLQQESCPSRLMPYRLIAGNRWHNLIMVRELSPYTLGMLIALYEHRVFSEGILLNINSFDQWGVELGKKIAKKIYAYLSAKERDLNRRTFELIEKIFSRWR